jgi:hypothetical protein
MQLLQTVLAAYGLDIDHLQTKVIGSGLIHRTWKVTANREHYILQEVNAVTCNSIIRIIYLLSRLRHLLEIHWLK